MREMARHRFRQWQSVSLWVRSVACVVWLVGWRVGHRLGLAPVCAFVCAFACARAFVSWLVRVCPVLG